MQIHHFNFIGLESRFLKTAILFAFLLAGTAGVLIFLIAEEMTAYWEQALLQQAEVRALQLADEVEEVILADMSQGIERLRVMPQKLKADLDAIYGQNESYLFCVVQGLEGAVVFKDSTGTMPGVVYDNMLFPEAVRGQSVQVFEHAFDMGDITKRFYLVVVTIVVQEQFLGVLKLGVSPQELTPQIENMVNMLIHRHMLGALALAIIGAFAVWQTVRLMREARELELQAKKTDQLVFLGTIASELAHEIRNPLSAISVDSELLIEVAEEMDADNRAEMAKLSLNIGDSVRYLNATLSSFLQFARPSSLSRVRVKPNALVLEMVRLIGRQCARQGILLEWEAPDDVPEIDVDVPQIKQALLNVLINAQQAMPDGGVLAVHIRVVSDAIWIDVSDTGDGIPEDEQERVFNFFHSNKSGGSGLGLAIARRILDMHGGRLDLHSKVGEGATFSMRLPVAHGEGHGDDS